MVNFELGGVKFKVIVKAKHHTNAIKRDPVMLLNEKVRTTGCQKGLMVATAPYQYGALEYAKTHGIALVTETVHI